MDRFANGCGSPFDCGRQHAPTFAGCENLARMVADQVHPGLDTAVLLDELSVQGRLLVESARRAGSDAAVPSCPEWTVADLLRHVGEVHRWATSIVATRAHDEGDSLASLGDVPPDGRLADWVADGCRTLVETLRAARRNSCRVSA